VCSFGPYFKKLAKLSPLQNCIPYQSMNSSVCGHFCLFFVHMRVNGYTYKQILDRFKINKKWNDLMVKRFYECNVKNKCAKLIVNKPCQSCDSRLVNIKTLVSY
jgi:hypothetical protein